MSAKKQEEEVVAVEPEVEKTPETELPSLLKKHKDAPEQSQIDAWKAKFDDVYVSGFSEEDLYIWRAISRQEFINLQLTAQENQMTQWQMEEATCEICILWPEDVGAKLQKKAGTAGTLSEQIMQNSNFLAPQAASMLVAKL